MSPRGSVESQRAASALRDYLNLGRGRSLKQLAQNYRADAAAPTHAMGTLQRWARQYDWQGRAQVFDGQDDLAQTGQRVEHLKRLYAGLQDYLRQAWPVWLADLHSDAPGLEGREISRAPRFNTGIIIQMRGILDDLARETGGRAPKVGPVVMPAAAPDLSLLSEEELFALECLLQKAAPPGGQAAQMQQTVLPGFGA